MIKITTTKSYAEEDLLSKYIGVQIDAGRKAFVSRENYGYGNFVMATGSSGVTNGNYYVRRKTLQALLKHYKNKSIFVFDTPQELFKWLAE